MPMPIDWMDMNTYVCSWSKAMFPDVSYFAQNQHYIIINISDKAAINLESPCSF